MESSAFTDAKKAWDQTYHGFSQEEINRRARGLRSIVRGIYRDGAVSVGSFAEELGIDTDEEQALFTALADFGMEFDESGNIVGAALTNKETPHTVRVGERTLYAWCALDTLFIPGLLNETAEVGSICPVSEEDIRLSVSPKGVVEFAPQEVVLSVVLPNSAQMKIGFASPT